ncbi:TetR/AcrR family transcriptional regulator [Hoyosella rhizosphaerae]|uniref:TetR family transcriptional regulator n=1 Tax=Hoyosella rhizosphaerae TaxID=1755582 RepID=A0A916U4S0_9ACTN|nr:TetR/AcrR family transcriptional regulator [Hoyosella rhizosphaerae]MBN4926656.1 TetR/AcrR family transcriptional regulator [Hoyosella rhizosphaerae]GGC57520.1 TetR family transcriptional regulator [Hoyosella rhizosphaerae]
MAATPKMPEVRRAQILATAIDMLATHSFESLTIEKVARKAGVSPPLLFHYFTNKEGFHNALLAEAAETFLGRIRPKFELPADQQLCDAVRSFFDTVDELPTVFLAVKRLSSSGQPQLRKRYREVRTITTGWIVDNLIALGVKSTPQLPALLEGWQAFMEEVAVKWLDDPILAKNDLCQLCETALYLLLPAAKLDANELERALASLGRDATGRHLIQDGSE